MAFRSNSPVTLTLPPFRGVTRKLVLAAVALFLAQAVLGMVYAPLAVGVRMNLILTPHMAFFGRPWQFVTYAFESLGLLSTLFAALTIWIFGGSLEDERGGRWLTEYFSVSAIGGGLLAALISLPGIGGMGSFESVFGLTPVAIGLLLASARFHPEEQVRFNFVLQLKLKYLAAIYVLFYLALALLGQDRFSAATALCVWLCGYVYLRYAPRRGMRFAASEGWYGARNAYYRWKRKRAARAFQVYMKKQGRDVPIAPEERHGSPGDPKGYDDRRWMN